MRMSSGASLMYEKPRSGRSSCIDETPRSSRIASARTPFPASCGRTTPKSPRRSREFTGGRFASCSKYVRAVGSRSIAMSLPLPHRSAARIAACPPAPKVASMTVSPGRTASAARTSSARTGTWSASLGCKTFGNILSTPFDLGELALPGGAVPDLEVVVDPGDDDVAAELRVLEQRGRDAHPPLFVRRRVAGAGEEMSLHLTAFLAQRMEGREGRLAVVVPTRRRPGPEAAIEAPGDDASVLERTPELGREREPVLVIDRVLVFTKEHGAALPISPLSPTINHFLPQVHPFRTMRRLVQRVATAPRGRLRPRGGARRACARA